MQENAVKLVDALELRSSRLGLIAVAENNLVEFAGLIDTGPTELDAPLRTVITANHLVHYAVELDVLVEIK